jgi:hypothetical protein
MLVLTLLFACTLLYVTFRIFTHNALVTDEKMKPLTMPVSSIARMPGHQPGVGHESRR